MGSDLSEVSSQLNTPRVILLGTHPNVNVSAIALGVIVNLSRKKVSVAVGHLGDSLVKATHSRRMTARLAHTLDPWALSKDQIMQAFARLAGGAEIMMLEGEDGIFDLYPRHWSVGTCGEFGQILKTPIVLVVDVAGYGETIGPMVRGLISHNPNLRIKGIIASAIADDRHGELIRKTLEEIPDILYLGGIPSSDSDVLSSTENTGDASNPSLLPRGKIIASGEMVKTHIDLESLRQISASAGQIEVSKSAIAGASHLCKIGVADDLAFHLTVQDNLDLIRRSGGQLKAFSPIADFKLPSDISAIYLPNGYVQVYARDLSQNTTMLESIAGFARRGGLIYAEGGAVGYLCEKVMLYDGSVYDMCNVLPGIASSQVDESSGIKASRTFVRSICENPLCPSGVTIRGFRENRWKFSFSDDSLKSAFEMVDEASWGENFQKATLHDGTLSEIAIQASSTIGQDGFMLGDNLIATSAQLHWGSCPEIASRFVRRSKRINEPAD